MPVHQTVSKKCKLSRRFSDYKITSPLAIHRNGRTKLRYHVDENEKSSKAPISSILSRVPDKPTAAGVLNFFSPARSLSPPISLHGGCIFTGLKSDLVEVCFHNLASFSLHPLRNVRSTPSMWPNRFQPICLFAVQTRLFFVVLFFQLQTESSKKEKLEHFRFGISSKSICLNRKHFFV